MNEPWIDHLTEQFQNKILEVVGIWSQIGISSERYNERSNALTEHVYTLLEEILEEEYLHKEEIELSVSNLMLEVKDLCSELRISYNQECSESLIVQENLLLLRRNELIRRKETLISRFRTLLTLERHLCERLCELKLNFDPDCIPSEFQLKELENHIDNLEKIQKIRVGKFILKRGDIIKYITLLNLPPSKNDFVQSILNDKDGNSVPLSESFLFDCDCLIVDLIEEYERNVSEFFRLREQFQTLHKALSSMYDLMPVSPLHGIEEFTPENRNLLKTEIFKLKQMRLEKMDNLVGNSRNQLQDLMRRNYASHLIESEKYQYLLLSQVNESLLDDLDAELEKWCSTQRDLEPFNKEIEIWEKLIGSLIDINISLKDPVICRNRGGILLKIEKEKIAMKKELLKCETKLRAAFKSLDKSKINFDPMINKMSLDEYIAQKLCLTEYEKDNKRREKIKTTSKSDVSKRSSINKAVLRSKEKITL